MRKLTDIFVVPPISVLDPKQKYWKDRKKHWNNIINDSSLGRDDNLLKMSFLMSKKHLKTSVFDPVLAEILILWFSKEKDIIIDPFCGGTVRAEIASILNRKYVGYDVRKEQIEHNNNLNILNTTFINESAENIESKEKYDFMLTCPPYLWLEKYSNLFNDLSTMSENNFYKTYENILKKLIISLKNDRFIAIVLSNVRRKDGTYSNLVGETINIMAKNDIFLYNDMILLQEPASASMRSFNYMNSSRKIAKNHQNILVFIKGNPIEATKRLEKFKDNV